MSLSIKKYNLYSSQGCHLCEQALAICASVLATGEFEEIDIVDIEKVSHETQTLVELYGVHIPVLEQLHSNPSNNKKLFWPFTEEQVIALTKE